MAQAVVDRMEGDMRERLLELAERCEAASGPDRELDAAIYDITPDSLDYQRIVVRLKNSSRLGRYHDGWVTVYGYKGEADPYPEDLPRYTSSFDRAMTLVSKDECWKVEVSPFSGPGAVVGDDLTLAATPILALCAAALKARATQEQPE